jgi:hypothetical protein
MLAVVLFLAGCGGGHTTRTQETGYKGKARLDAYLAADRFLVRMGEEVINRHGWPELADVAVMLVPASVLSTEAYVDEVDEWVREGGHLICLVGQAESFHDDWRGGGAGYLSDREMPEPLEAWLEDTGFTFDKGADKRSAEKFSVDGREFEVFAESSVSITADGSAQGPLAQRNHGEGIVTVMMDARPFRNRYIGDHDHAEMLLALVEQSPYSGAVAIIRDGGLSLWTLLWRHGWPALTGLVLLTLLWLWKNMPRFGPLRRQDEPSNLRDYAHHLEALGDFQWRLDKGAAMLRPLRDGVLERAARASAGGHRDGDLFEWLAQRAGISRDRAERAMTHERPADPTTFTRIVADLQLLHLSLP